MQEISVYDTNGNMINTLVQWDSNVYVHIEVSGIDVENVCQIHFFNQTMENAYVVETVPTDTKSIIKAKIPNILLTYPHAIIGYLRINEGEEERSLFRFRLNIIKRPRPDNFVFIDTKDYINLETVLAECKEYAVSANDSSLDSERYASISKSYAVGTNGDVRNNDAVDNAKYYFELVQELVETFRNRPDKYTQIIDLTASTYDRDTYYPVTGTPIPKGGLHLIHTYSTFGTVPSWATNTAGYTCNMEVYDKAQQWGQADGATIATDYSWKHTNQRPCGYVQMPHTSTPVVLLRGGGYYIIETDYEAAWTVRTAVYTLSDDTVQPLQRHTFEFDRATVFANINGNVTGSLTGNASTATTLGTKRYIDGVAFDGSANIAHYGTCSTAAATAAKTVSITGFSLVTGARVTVLFSNGNTAASPTLNVSSTGAKPIYYQSVAVPETYKWAAGAAMEFVYDGTYWVMLNGMTATTTYYGVTKLSSSTSSTSTTLAATPSAVKSAYDLATAASTAASAAQTRVDSIQEQMESLSAACVRTLWSGALYTNAIINFFVPEEYWHDGNLTLMIDCVRTGVTSAYPHAKTVMLCLPRYHALYSYTISTNTECSVYSARYTGDGTAAFGNVYEKFTDKTGGCNDIIDIEAYVSPLTTTNYAAVYIQKNDSSVYVITNVYAVVPEEG